MKILIVNTFDRGGAANSCNRLHKGLLLAGIVSKVLLKFNENNWTNSFCFKQVPKKRSVANKIKNKILHILKRFKLFQQNEEQNFLRRQKGLEMFSFPDSGLDITQDTLYKEADIINLHWVANFLDYTSFFQKNKKPVVWTLHDMNPFTGGEHYNEKFLGIDDEGYPIKRQVSVEEKKVSLKNSEIKKRALSKVQNLTIVTPSEWLAKEARKSDVFKNIQVFCIPYGLDIEIFKPRDKNNSRDLLGIPKDKKVILFVADSISNHRKGFTYLNKAFEQLANNKLVLCAIGSNKNDLKSLNYLIKLGFIHDERLLSIAYSAADVFVIPSLMDNLPNTVLESLLCGTPVIGFPIGGITDMIQDGQNGFLTEEVSVASLVVTLQKFLINTTLFDSKKIRANAVKKYDQNIQARRYIKLFQDILNKNV